MDAVQAIAPADGNIARRLPTGTVVFLFTDIEGSTVRWDRQPEAMQRAVRRHDELMREAIEGARGVVFKTIGDAFCATFWNIADAIAATLAAQRAFAAEDFADVEGIRVRMALHSGTADERDADYFGPTVNRVARLLAIAHGEQVVLSRAAAEAAAALPHGTTLRDLGEHRLKDLTTPECVFQLEAPGLRTEFPRLNSLSVLNTNLPPQLTSFIGRESDLADIIALLRGNRLVTLVGTGGVGKTRCSVQAGAEVLDSYRDGVWFADFAPLREPTQIATAIGEIFGVQETASRPVLEGLTAHLRTKQLLLILDNCEHVIDEASRVTAALLRACPTITILATSREPLNVGGELIHRLPTLEVPPSSKHLTAERALRYGAIALFDARARAATGHFALTAENVGLVVDICTRLDGIALAIELAAARTRALSLRDLAVKLDERFRVLTGGDRTALPRQQTLRALIDWSYDGLPQAEQRVFRALSVFAGGFGLQTALTVCGTENLDAIEVLDATTALVDKSLVAMEAYDDDAHYRLLESTRAYAREKLREHGEEAAATRRHAQAYAAFAEELEAAYDSTSTPVWYARVEFELENVRAALASSFEDGDVVVGQRLAAASGRLLVPFAAAQARRWVTLALGRVDEATPLPLVARLRLADALLATVLNQFKPALHAASEALAIFEQLGDRRRIADAQRFKGRSLVRMDRVAEGETLLYEALATYEAIGMPRTGGALRDLAVARSIARDLPAARDLFSRALVVFRASQDEENVAITGAALAEAEFACGDPHAALIAAGEALDAMGGLGRDRMIAAQLGNIAAYLTAIEAYDLAQQHARSALSLALDADAQASVTFILQHLGAIGALRQSGNGAENQSGPADAARLLGYADARLAALEIEREFTEQYEYDAALAALRARLTPGELDRLLAEGRALSAQRAVDLALAG